MRKAYSALKYVCIVALVISMIALVAVVAYVLINGVDKLSADLLFGDYLPTSRHQTWPSAPGQSDGDTQVLRPELQVTTMAEKAGRLPTITVRV